MDTKYDEAAYKKISSKSFAAIPLEELNQIKKNNSVLFEKEYAGRLYCPECQCPQLSLVKNNNTGDYYLRGYKNQEHKELCPKGFDEVNHTCFDKLLSDDCSIEFINNKLQKLIDKLCNKLTGKELLKALLVKTEDKKCLQNDITDDEIKKRANVFRLPIKSITAPFDDNDYDCYKLFYGNVDILLKEKIYKDERPFYILKILKKGINYTLCSLAMSKYVGKYVMKRNNIPVDRKISNVYIAFASSIKNNDNHYKKGNIKHSEYCVIARI